MRGAFLRRLKVRNFKSFADLDVELEGFNVLVGYTASGKSNFVQILQFLKDMRGGLAGALAMQGGIEHVRNFNGGNRVSFGLEMDFPAIRLPRNLSGPPYMLHNTRVKWSFEMEAGRRSGFKILSDEWRFYITAAGKQERIDGVLNVKSENGKLLVEPDFPVDAVAEKLLNLYRALYGHGPKAAKNASILESRMVDAVFPWVGDFFGNLGIYDFDPKLAKRPSAAGGRPGLEADGSNLPLVLRGILSSAEKKRRFDNLASDMLPFVKSLGAKSAAGKSVAFMTESYPKGGRLPAALVSDGTAGAAALLVALHFQDAQLAVIEEPERGVHPALLSGMVDAMKDASSSKQIIITTHSPEIVRRSGIDRLLLARRGDSGSSLITRPSEDREVRPFLESGMDVGEMHVQRLLGD